MSEAHIQTNGNGFSTDVGAWYITYNTEKMWQDNFGSGNPIKYRVRCSDKTEDYRIPVSDDPAIVDYHLSLFEEAGIDFMLLDLTNGGLMTKLKYGTGNEWIVDNALFTCKRVCLWNETHSWKIRYAVAVGVYPAIRGFVYDADGNLLKEGCRIGEATEWQAQAVYEKFYQNPELDKGNYYQLDGKPLLVIHDWGENVLTVPHGWNAYRGDRTYGDRFTVRNGECGQGGTYGWQTSFGTQPHPEVEVVCPGWASAHNGGGKISRENGEYYRRCWEIVAEKPPRIVMITAFNDYNESCAILPTDTTACDSPQEEQWRNSDGKLEPDLYWNMTKYYIKKLRG